MKLHLNGSAFQFFIMNILWGIVDILTIGLLVPFHIHAIIEYTINNTEILTDEKGSSEAKQA